MLDDSRFFLKDINSVELNKKNFLYHNDTQITWLVQGKSHGIDYGFSFTPPSEWVAKTYKALGNYVTPSYSPFVVSEAYNRRNPACFNYIIGDDKFSVSASDRDTLRKAMSDMVNLMYRFNSRPYITYLSRFRFKEKQLFEKFHLLMDMSLYDATEINKKYKCFNENIVKGNNKVFVFVLNSNCSTAGSIFEDWLYHTVCNVFAFDGEAFLKNGKINTILDTFHTTLYDGYFTLYGNVGAYFKEARSKALGAFRNVLFDLMKAHPGLAVDQVQVLPNTNSNLCGYNLIPVYENRYLTLSRGEGQDEGFSMLYGATEVELSDILNFVVCLEA